MKDICRVVVLGSTGSIGRQTLEVVAEHPDRFEIYAITAHRSAELLISQARAFLPKVVVIADESLYPQVAEALSDLPIEVCAGAAALCDVVIEPVVDVVVTAMVGFAGLGPTVAAIRAGKTIALANKETLVVAGEQIMQLVKKHNARILPVDSEHSAIFQCLAGEQGNRIEKLLVTASGGPFRTFTLEQMQHVTAAQALKHPNWSMGAKITIDSASMMNKAFEVIEARWLFDLHPDRIEVVVHPQSIVHSMVQFEDGAVKAQLGQPDMKVPIAYALSYPERLLSQINGRLSVEDYTNLTFERPDLQRFPNLKLAYDALREGGNRACVINAANEVVNEAFREGRCGFLQMSAVIEETLLAIPNRSAADVEEYFAMDAEARLVAMDKLKTT